LKSQEGVTSPAKKFLLPSKLPKISVVFQRFFWFSTIKARWTVQNLPYKWVSTFLFSSTGQLNTRKSSEFFFRGAAICCGRKKKGWQRDKHFTRKAAENLQLCFCFSYPFQMMIDSGKIGCVFADENPYQDPCANKSPFWSLSLSLSRPILIYLQIYSDSGMLLPFSVFIFSDFVLLREK
jgi:hypothetical protein